MVRACAGWSPASQALQQRQRLGAPGLTLLGLAQRPCKTAALNTLQETLQETLQLHTEQNGKKGCKVLAMRFLAATRNGSERNPAVISDACAGKIPSWPDKAIPLLTGWSLVRIRPGEPNAPSAGVRRWSHTARNRLKPLNSRRPCVHYCPFTFVLSP
jgi:hypothetical protein